MYTNRSFPTTRERVRYPARVMSTEPSSSDPSAPASSSSTEPAADLPRCACGHTRDHYMVSSDCTYSVGGYIWLIIGVTVYPIRVRFRCRKCGEVFETSTDPAVCKKYR